MLGIIAALGLLAASGTAWPRRLLALEPPRIRPAARTPIALRRMDRSSAQDDTVRGRVVDRAGLPIANATVTVTSVVDQSWNTTRTDTAGAYAVAVTSSTNAYVVAVMRPGYVMQRRRIERVGSAIGTLIANFQLIPIAEVLPPIRAIAQRPKPRREEIGSRASPGSSPQPLAVGTGLNGDLTGDLDAALATVPGISVIPDGNGGFTTSAFGLSADQNAATLDGMDATGSTLTLRDGLVGSVALSSYDPKRGRAAGALIDWNLPSGSNASARLVHLTLDDRFLQWTTPTAAALGDENRDLIVSGTASGPIVVDRASYSTSYQVSHDTRDLVTLNSANASSLQALGISPDSVRKITEAEDDLGIPSRAATAPNVVSSTKVTALARFDLMHAVDGVRAPDGTESSVIIGGGWGSSENLGASPTGFASQLGESRHVEASLLGHLSSFMFGSALNDFKSRLSLQDDRVTPYAHIPAASILLASQLPDGTDGLSVLGASSSPAQSHTEVTRWESSDETSWLSWGEHHRFDVFADAELSRLTLTQSANRFGTFAFNSIGDFIAGRPATFTRTSGGPPIGVQSVLGTLAVSDVYAPRFTALGPGLGGDGGLVVQYGVRADIERFIGTPAYNPTVDSLFGRRTNRLPGEFAMAPMVGFTYNAGTTVETSISPAGRIAIRPTTRYSLAGGIREYESTLPAQGVANVLRRTGVPGAVEELQCIGPAAPSPDWAAYVQSPGAIPNECAGGTPSQSLAQLAPAVTLYAPDFSPTRSSRAELKWTYFLSGQLQGWLGGTYALNQEQPQAYDVNFEPTVHLILPAEDGRPVFVGPASIAATSGAIALGGSRQFVGLGHVSELRSNLASDQRQLTGGLTFRVGTRALNPGDQAEVPRVNAIVNIAYAYTDGRAQTSGFMGTTAGDPRVAAWGPAVTPHHSVQLSLTANVDRFVSISTYARATSGFFYTPTVSADINGDGYANDRAYVFDPAATSDRQLASGMARLLATAPGGARDCLRRQLGRIVNQNSCEGPWSASVGTVALAFDPYRLHLGNRGSLVLYFTNVLGGLDYALHGAAHLRNWGDIAYPNTTLLSPTGFDQASAHFQYLVNPQFGSARANALVAQQPFRLTVDFHLAVGPDVETERIDRYMRPEEDGIDWNERTLKSRLLRIVDATGVRWLEDPKVADTLHLTTDQRLEISDSATQLEALRDSVFGDLAQFLVAHQSDLDGAIVRERWHRAFEAELRFRFDVGAQAARLLTPEQLDWARIHLPAAGLAYSHDWLEREARAPLP